MNRLTYPMIAVVLFLLGVGFLRFDAATRSGSALVLGAGAEKPDWSTHPEAAGIRQSALDYVESWYEGNPERMERCLHPDLAKRIVRTDPKSGRSRLDQMSALGLVQGVRTGHGKNTPKEKQQKDVTILDIYQNAACVKAIMSGWIDYMHLAKSNGRWVIVNVLWELKPDASTQSAPGPVVPRTSLASSLPPLDAQRQISD